MLDVQLFDLQSFLPLPYQEALLPRLKGAHEKLQNGSGLGGELTGRNLPESKPPPERFKATLKRWWSSASAAAT